MTTNDKTVGDEREGPFGIISMIIRDIAELDNAPVDADAGDKLIASPEEMRVILERHLTTPSKEPAGAVAEWSIDLKRRLYASLMYYANMCTYEAPRIGGVLQGCPRGLPPSPEALTVEARFMLAEIEEAIGRVPPEWMRPALAAPGAAIDAREQEADMRMLRAFGHRTAVLSGDHALPLMLGPNFDFKFCHGEYNEWLCIRFNSADERDEFKAAAREWENVARDRAKGSASACIACGDTGTVTDTEGKTWPCYQHCAALASREEPPAVDAGGKEALTNDNFAADWLTNRAPLHPKTIDLVVRFARALAAKLAAAEVKYGYSDGWLSPDWMDECRAKLLEHINKGDPRDVAAYCAFLWHHGESTASRPEAPPASASPAMVAQPVAYANPVIMLPDEIGGEWSARMQSHRDDVFTMPLYAAQPCPSQGCGGAGSEAMRYVPFNLYDAVLPEASEHSTSYGGQWSSAWCVVITPSGNPRCEKFTVSELEKEMLDRGERPHNNWHKPGWPPRYLAWAYCKDVLAALKGTTPGGEGA